MIYVNIFGGLGNQMFQYAIAKSLSMAHNVDFKIDIYKMNNYQLRDFSLSKFNISSPIADKKETQKYRYNKYIDFVFKKIYPINIKFINKIYEKKEFHFDSNMKLIKNGYLYGYWQSFKYFDDIRDLLIKEFTLVEEMNIENIKLCKTIESNNSISIHIRRGDYINNPVNNKLYNVVPIEYYKKAIRYVEKNIKNPVFFVFSDDLEWASENLKLSNANFVNINSVGNPEMDLVLMSKCNHNIIANSTFSWWGAYLNQNPKKIVIAPKKWMSTFDNLDDLYPENWLRI